ncbi:hypothetical protein [Rossellomorea sp. FM04394]|uniref:hypothetical protein n=1 Tax=Rossellomorea sp. FM04394 TaxID=3243076 RepID=UPI0035A72369
MSDMITFTHASSKKELERKLDQVKASHMAINQNKEVIVEVLDPNPDQVTLKDNFATKFTISVSIKNYDDEE